jgi:hypothetical protein
MIGFPNKTLQELELEKMYPVQANTGIGFPQGTPQSIGMNTMYPVQNKAVVPAVNSNQGQMQGQPQPRTGMAGLFDKLTTRSGTTGLSGLENFAASLDPLILPELRGGDAIRQRGAQRVKAGNVNKTIEYLKANGMADMAAIIEANPSAAGNVLSAIAANRLNPKDNRTTKMKDYKAAKDGGFAGSFTDFLKLQQSTTNIVNKQEAAYQKGMGEFGVKLVEKVNEDADNAANILMRTRQLENLMADPNFTSGALTDGLVQMRKIVETLGGDPANVSSMENFKAITSQLVLDSMGGSLGAGFSEGDREFVVSIQPDLGKTLEANVALIDMQRKIANRKLLIADMAAQYIKENGQLDLNFKTELRAWSRDNPIFKKEDAEIYFPEKGT